MHKTFSVCVLKSSSGNSNNDLSHKGNVLEYQSPNVLDVYCISKKFNLDFHLEVSDKMFHAPSFI